MLDIVKRNNIIFPVLFAGICMGVIFKIVDGINIDYNMSVLEFVTLIDIKNFLKDMSVWILISVYIAIKSKSTLNASFNVFIFFVAMTTSYYIVNLYIYNYNPMLYMIFWYLITFISPVFGYLFWFSDKDRWYSNYIRTFIFFTLSISSFYMGWIYIDLNSLLNISLLVIAVFIFRKRMNNRIVVKDLSLGVFLRSLLSIFLGI